MNYSDYIVYVDESGDHSLSSVDADYPIFVLSFCIFKKATYTSQVSPKLQGFKFKYFGHDAIVLHEREIRKQIGPFGFLQSLKIRNVFMDELTQLVDDLDMTIIAAVIRKEQYKLHSRPENPYVISLKFCLERCFEYLKDLHQPKSLHTYWLNNEAKRKIGT